MRNEKTESLVIRSEMKSEQLNDEKKGRNCKTNQRDNQTKKYDNKNLPMNTKFVMSLLVLPKFPWSNLHHAAVYY